MFRHLIRAILLEQIRQPLLKCAIVMKPDPILQTVYAVRIPGGLTPP